MPLIAPIYLVDSSGQQWQLAVTNAGILENVPVSGYPAVPYVYLNSITDGTSYQLFIVGNPPPTGFFWGQARTKSIPQGNYPTSLLVTAPNGIVYGIQVATVGPPVLGSLTAGILQTILPQAPNCNTPMSALANNVLSRLEDPTGIFWNESFEIYTALVEAMNDLMLLVGRPTQTVGLQFNLTPNTVWQTIPKGLFLISDIWGVQSRLRKGTLYDLDYNQASWDSSWENDTSITGPTMWAPLGFTSFIVHPAPASPQTVLLDGIAYPVAETNFPYTGAEIIPFHQEFFVLLEQYAAHYARIKESTAEFQESMALYQAYLSGAERMTEIESRKDPLIFSPAFGAPAGVNSHVKR